MQTLLGSLLVCFSVIFLLLCDSVSLGFLSVFGAFVFISLYGQVHGDDKMREDPERLYTCPTCKTYCLRVYETPRECRQCNNFLSFLRCTFSDCDFKTEICLKCTTAKLPQQKTKPQDNKCFIWCILTVIAIIPLIIYRPYSSVQDSPIGKLRHKFPSQKNETWYHILSVLEQKVPTVKSITLLYKNDRKTTDCLAKELLNIFNVDVKDVSFDLGRIRYRDYGEVLELYHSVVKKFRVLVTDLSVVPSDIARVFHSLCDEVSSDIKPSLFIFILKWDNKMEHLKPLEKTTAILKEYWNDLPDSDIFPLLSRIVKNVVDVIPEKHVTC